LIPLCGTLHLRGTPEASFSQTCAFLGTRVRWRPPVSLSWVMRPAVLIAKVEISLHLRAFALAERTQLVACNTDKRRPFSSSWSVSLPFRARLLQGLQRPLHRSPVRSWLVLHNTSHAEITSASAGTRSSRITASVTVQLTAFNACKFYFAAYAIRPVRLVRPTSRRSVTVRREPARRLRIIILAFARAGGQGDARQNQRRASPAKDRRAGDSNEIRLLNQSHPILCKEGRASNRGVYCLAGHLPELRVR
jgi:hypothetical protein